MFETALALEAFAAPPGVPDLGPTPILQVFGGIIGLMVFAIGALVWLRGERAPPAPPSSPPPQAVLPPQQQQHQQLADTGVHLYFDGPLRQIYGDLRKIEALVLESRELFAVALQQTRHDIKNEMHEDALEASHEIAQVEAAVINLRELVVRLDEYMRHHRRG